MLNKLVNMLSGLTRKSEMNASSRPDGGTSCYRPVRRKNPGEEELARQKAAEYAAENPAMPYAHTGFTGMNPAQGTDYGMSMMADYFGNNTAPYATSPIQGPESGTGFIPQRQDNISYMPGAFAPDSGNSYTHVEHIMAMTSLKSCYEAIECMKNGETLIVTLDAIANESESVRCQDMLAGAAFTLGCGVRTLQSGRLVLIAPAGVKILPEQHRNAYQPLRGAMPAVQEAPATSFVPAGRRERRMSQNTAGWDPARADENRGYNPYTGNMPVAVNAYAGFGGYGY